ncbi:MAG TPA: hypothetical protein VMU94_28730 [Streptosporangiaceae bacterium]|nr:hypothetical protein [Streptosporangiaceae bacterium]
MTCDQDHGYTDEQSAADHGAEDAYPASVGHNLTLAQCLSGFNFNGSPETVPSGGASNPAVLDYYDGNTVTACPSRPPSTTRRAPASTITMGGNNIGEELTTAGSTWGWFQGGFDDGYVPGQGTPPTAAQICSQNRQNVGGSTVTDYNRTTSHSSTTRPPPTPCTCRRPRCA